MKSHINNRMYSLIRCILMHTIYAVYLGDIKFSELASNANWWIYSVVKRTVLSVDYLTNTHNTCR